MDKSLDGEILELPVKGPPNSHLKLEPLHTSQYVETLIRHSTPVKLERDPDEEPDDIFPTFISIETKV